MKHAYLLSPSVCVDDLCLCHGLPDILDVGSRICQILLRRLVVCTFCLPEPDAEQDFSSPLFVQQARGPCSPYLFGEGSVHISSWSD